MAYPNATDCELQDMLKKAVDELAEFEQWRKTKPSGTWMHRSSGVWARTEIRSIKAEIAERSVR